jgi:hypothetical protein
MVRITDTSIQNNQQKERKKKLIVNLKYKTITKLAQELIFIQGLWVYRNILETNHSCNINIF